MKIFTLYVNDGNVLQTLAITQNIESLRVKIKEGKYFENLISKYLLNNNHGIRLIMKPDENYLNDINKKELEQLERIEKGLDENKKLAIK